jgi:PAS domain-containing protein
VSLACDPDFYLLLSGAYSRLVGEPLVADAGDARSGARWLYEAAPFCVLAHNAEAEPVFIYANRSAQDCFGYDWDEIIKLPSRLSAEAPERAERQRLLIAKSGQRFWIENATVWQLIDEAGRLHGQAAMFQKPSA